MASTANLTSGWTTNGRIQSKSNDDKTKRTIFWKESLNQYSFNWDGVAGGRRHKAKLSELDLHTDHLTRAHTRFWLKLQKYPVSKIVYKIRGHIIKWMPKTRSIKTSNSQWGFHKATKRFKIRTEPGCSCRLVTSANKFYWKIQSRLDRLSCHGGGGGNSTQYGVSTPAHPSSVQSKT